MKSLLALMRKEYMEATRTGKIMIIIFQKFSIPIYAWSATNDKTALTSDVEQWKNYTKYIFKHDVFSGDHFFLLNDINRTASTLCKIARVCLSI